jgi:predicted nucleic acid binding AN1-type Zn finger protein
MSTTSMVMAGIAAIVILFLVVTVFRALSKDTKAEQHGGSETHMHKECAMCGWEGTVSKFHKKCSNCGTELY